MKITDKMRMDWLSKQTQDLEICIDKKSKNERFILTKRGYLGGGGAWKPSLREAFDVTIHMFEKDSE